MQLFNLLLLGLLSLNSKAFEITIYNNVLGCEANDDSMYRIIGGPSTGTCYTFDDDMPDTYCDQYTRGGWEGPSGCVGASLLPMSVVQRNPIPCTFYSEKNCEGALQRSTDICVDGSALGISNWKSFSCTSDDSVDILANVGCHNAVSTNVCVNDCGFHCNGQVLVPGVPSPSGPLCSPETIAVCEKYCDCINP
ncbi:hypothetical protein B0J13DRAFT_677795 [Dactylonectria estremocensis]|uniref:Secreted LysM effector LysM C-terminal domain-containing protein n=1 Tax=Dactylonectria estremocensis TaxID=1079267 RepID=A0A9P9EH63_9HYPO|nr:hypothetical protein B0J13DRAFT_677795 [Dactylonectria estremocensis]